MRQDHKSRGTGYQAERTSEAGYNYCLCYCTC